MQPQVKERKEIGFKVKEGASAYLQEGVEGQARHLDIRTSAPMEGRGGMTQEELRLVVAEVRRQCELGKVE